MLLKEISKGLEHDLRIACLLHSDHQAFTRELIKGAQHTEQLSIRCDSS